MVGRRATHCGVRARVPPPRSRLPPLRCATKARAGVGGPTPRTRPLRPLTPCTLAPRRKSLISCKPGGQTLARDLVVGRGSTVTGAAHLFLHVPAAGNR